jgi:hypothetical protein
VAGYSKGVDAALPAESVSLIGQNGLIRGGSSGTFPERGSAALNPMSFNTSFLTLFLQKLRILNRLDSAGIRMPQYLAQTCLLRKGVIS